MEAKFKKNIYTCIYIHVYIYDTMKTKDTETLGQPSNLLLLFISNQ